MGKSAGRFITFEGPEGSGKTLQIKLLAGELDRRGIAYTTTREPGGTEFGKEVREILLKNGGATRQPISELMLYLADRYQHIHEIVLPALKKNEIVLSDRYHDATLAYQGYARGVDMDLIGLFFDRLGLLVPDQTIVFDIDVEIALARARSRNLTSDQDHMGRFEAEDQHPEDPRAASIPGPGGQGPCQVFRGERRRHAGRSPCQDNEGPGAF